MHVENGKQSRKRKDAMHFCRHGVLIILSYVLQFCSLRYLYVELSALTSEGRHQRQSFDRSSRSSRSSIRLHAELVKTVLLRSINSVIAGAVNAMGKTGRHRLSCQDVCPALRMVDTNRTIYYCIYIVILYNI